MLNSRLIDLLEVFRLAGACTTTSYIFCGNHIGSGHDNIIVLSLLACLKVRYPDRITILRSSHDRSVKVNQCIILTAVMASLLTIHVICNRMMCSIMIVMRDIQAM